MDNLNCIKLALIQLNTGQDIEKNFSDFQRFLETAANGQANLILTPEVTNLITNDHDQRLKLAATDEKDRFISLAKKIAKKNKVWILLGSLAFRSKFDKKCKNRSFLINSEGIIVAHYDKIHMFDVNLSKKETYKESEFYQSGSKVTLAETEFGKIGMTVCYDVRFPNLYTKLALKGANIITVPSAFTAKTGAKHWEVLLRARAIETGAFIIAPAQTGKHGSLERISHGNSMVVSPDGTVLLNLGQETGVGFVKVNLRESDEYKSKIPSLKNIVELY